MGQDKYQAMGDGIYAQVGGPQNVAKINPLHDPSSDDH